ncbi:hypothetical protein EZV62_016700 [Acer yangbiense]|uniref:Legume lectin domain-containing protein n=1 Tax=Acer yangbiense TaxID=1000413 RepID=A0A5C7HPD8_9ROSI|nr:hypothetical protein EZV62_016700 [Acer yangbiense]
MASSTRSTLSLAFQSLLFLIFFFPVDSVSQLSENNVEFIYNGFNETENNSTKLTLEGASIFKPYGALRLTNRSNGVIGHAFYPHKIQMSDKNNNSKNASSFSTHFVFAIHTPSPGQGGFGLAFTIAPSTRNPQENKARADCRLRYASVDGGMAGIWAETVVVWGPPTGSLEIVKYSFSKLPEHVTLDLLTCPRTSPCLAEARHA